MKSVCIGAMEGYSHVDINHAGATLSCNGNESLGLGGLTGDCDICLDNTEIKGKIKNQYNKVTLASADRITVKDGAFRLTGADPV